MTVVEQELLFASLRRDHPDWPVRLASGYVHGAHDEGLYDKPQVSTRHPRKDEYRLGYLVGFAVRRGLDAESEKWFRFIGDLLKEAHV
jgi:hypothetical protein